VELGGNQRNGGHYNPAQPEKKEGRRVEILGKNKEETVRGQSHFTVWKRPKNQREYPLMGG